MALQDGSIVRVVVVAIETATMDLHDSSIVSGGSGVSRENSHYLKGQKHGYWR